MGGNSKQRDPSTGRFLNGNTAARGFGRPRKTPHIAINHLDDELQRPRKYKKPGGGYETIEPLKKIARDFVTRLLGEDPRAFEQFINRVWPVSARLELTGEDGDAIRISTDDRDALEGAIADALADAAANGHSEPSE